MLQQTHLPSPPALAAAPSYYSKVCLCNSCLSLAVNTSLPIPLHNTLFSASCPSCPGEKLYHKVVQHLFRASASSPVVGIMQYCQYVAKSDTLIQSDTLLQSLTFTFLTTPTFEHRTRGVTAEGISSIAASCRSASGCTNLGSQGMTVTTTAWVSWVIPLQNPMELLGPIQYPKISQASCDSASAVALP